MSFGDKRGFALPIAVGALVIMSILVVTGFFISRQEIRIGVASKHAAMAVNIAQAGANEVMANWNGYQLGNIPVWGDTTITATIASGTWEVTIRNANNYVYLMRAQGTVTEGGALWAGATRQIGIVTKMVFADISPPAALTTRGTTVVKGNAAINGANTTPPAWAPYCTGLPTNDLDLRGNFLFYGLIIVQGNFETQGNGNRIIGAVMASNGLLDDQSITGGSEVTYSRCTVQRAILNNASLSRARPLSQRSWVDLTAVMN